MRRRPRPRRRRIEDVPKENTEQKPRRNYVLPIIGSVAALIVALTYYCISDRKPEHPIKTNTSSQQISQQKPLTHRSEHGYPSIDDLAKLEGVSEIVDKRGEYPDAIILAIDHPQMVVGTFKSETKGDTTKAAEKISFQLYDKYRVRSLMLGGLNETTVRLYNQSTPRSLTANVKEDDIKKFFGSYERILNQRKWVLYSGEDERIYRRQDIEMAPIRVVHKWFKTKLIDEYERVFNELGTWDGERFTFPPIEDVKVKMDDFNKNLIAEAYAQLEKILNPEKMKVLHNLAVIQRDKKYAAQAALCKATGQGPVLIALGESHAYTLPGHLEGLDYAILRPEGHSGFPIVPPTPEAVRQSYFIMPVTSQTLDLNGKINEEGKLIFER